MYLLGASAQTQRDPPQERCDGSIALHLLSYLHVWTAAPANCCGAQLLLHS